MDAGRFDEFTRLLGGTVSRRQTVRLFAAGFGGLLAGRGFTRHTAAAVCGNNGAACDPNDAESCCIDFRCSDETNTCVLDCGRIFDACADDSDCCSDLFCVDGTCNVQPG